MATSGHVHARTMCIDIYLIEQSYSNRTFTVIEYNEQATDEMREVYTTF